MLVMIWKLWSMLLKCFYTTGKSDTLKILVMQKTKSQECALLKPHFGMLSGSWIDSAVGTGLAPALTSGENLESQPHCQSIHGCILLKCSAEAVGFLLYVEGLAFHVSIINKVKPFHQWVRPKRQSCSCNDRSPGQKMWLTFFDIIWKINLFVQMCFPLKSTPMHCTPM